MASIYLHIPFCVQRCKYCNFFSSTLLAHIQEYVQALQQEITLRHQYLTSTRLSSIYFGGGTPSLLSAEDINAICNTICQYFHIDSHTEITLEANPNNLTPQYIADLTSTPVNRLSIGIQSFCDDNLHTLGRIHTARQAANSINWALQHGYSQLSIDLMYGYPLLTMDQWQYNLEQARGIPHLSCYALTLEPHSLLYKQIAQHKYTLPSDDEVLQQYHLLTQYAQKQGLEHYETSNFCLPGYYSIHNTAYWQNQPYLGIGCGAHSFNGTSRQWNVGNIPLYIQLMNSITSPLELAHYENTLYEKENLSLTTRVNEYIMTSLRTMWGCNINYISEHFSPLYAEKLLKKISLLPPEQYLLQSSVLYLSYHGALFADAIASELFFEEEDILI